MKTRQSINHFTGREQNSLNNIAKKIVDRLQPLVVYCWGSDFSNGIKRNCFSITKKREEWSFYCDLLIIIPNNVVVGDGIQEQIAELTQPFGKVRAIIHPLDFLAAELKNGNLFFSWVHRSAIVLYEKGNIREQLLPPVSKKWQQQAEQFYLRDPAMASYLDEKIRAVNQVYHENKKGVKRSPIEIHLRFEIKEGGLSLVSTNAIPRA